MEYTIMSLQQLQDLWNIWSTRILITVIILALYDYYYYYYYSHPSVPWWRLGQQQQQQQQQSPTLNYNELHPSITRNNNNSNHNHSFLNRLEEKASQQQQQGRQESAGDDETKLSMEAMPNETTSNPQRVHDSIGNEKQEATERGKSMEEKKSKKQKKTSKQTQLSTASTTASASKKTPPPIKATSNVHPGLKAFNYWYDVETSLFRIYTLGRNDGLEVVPPYVPHSYRGNVAVHLHVTNKTNTHIKVFWVSYSGQHVFKGDLKPNHVWTQSTYIDHPWVFEHADTQTPVLYYIPYRVMEGCNLS